MVGGFGLKATMPAARQRVARSAATAPAAARRAFAVRAAVAQSEPTVVKREGASPPRHAQATAPYPHSCTHRSGDP